MLFNYKAVDQNGVIHSDSIEANNTKEVYEILRAKQLTPIDIKGKMEKKKEEEKKKTVLRKDEKVDKLKEFLVSKPKIKSKELVFLFYNLSTMIDSGVPIDKAIEISVNQMKTKLAKQVLREILDDIKKGMNLSDAIRKTEAFPRLVAPIISAGEESGNLEKSFGYLSEYYENQSKIGSKLTSALIYPIIVFIGVIVALYVVSTKVLPNILNIVYQSDVELGITTKSIIFISDFFTEYGILPVALTILVPIILIMILKRLNPGRLDRVFVKMPLVGSFIKQSSSIQFTTTLYILLSSGVTINRSLDICIEVIKNKYIKEQLDNVKRGVMRGESLSENLSEDLFGKVACNIISIGEESGQLVEPLNKTTKYLSEQLEDTTKKLLDLIAPVTILIIAGVVGFIVLGTLQPIMSIYQNSGL